TSDEYITSLVKSAFQKYLLRPAAPGDITNWINLFHRGLRDQDLIATLVGSAEYFSTRGSNDNTKWLQAVYPDLLNRPLDPGGQQNFLAQLAAGVPRTTIVREILASDEYLTKLIQSDFTKYLGRSASQGDINSFLPALHGGATFEQIINAIVSSGEYFQNHIGSATTQAGQDANWANAVYLDVLGRAADSGGLMGFEQFLA